MAEHQPANWTLFCIVIDEKNPFPVKIQPDATVGELKKAIKLEKQPEFDDFAADRLTLYLVNLPDDDDLAKIVKQPLTIKLPTALRATNQIGDLFPDGPTKETAHILVQIPDTCKANLKESQQSTSAEFVSYVDAVKVFTETLGVYTVEDLRKESNNTHLHIAPDVSLSPLLTGSPYSTAPLVSVYVEKLDTKRLVSPAQLQTLKEAFGSAWAPHFEPHFEVSDDKQLSRDEFEVYTVQLQTFLRRLDGIKKNKCSSFFKDSHMTVHLVDAALFVDTIDTWKYDKSVRLIMPCRDLPSIRNVTWEPVLLSGSTADVASLYTFRPRSDFCFFYPTYGPSIIAEIVSGDSESDRSKMLFEGIAVCRYQNMLQNTRKAIVLCLYLNKHYGMERYLVYQAEGVTRDVHILHDLTLDLTTLGNAFLLSKHLFNFRDHFAGVPEINEDVQKNLPKTQKRLKEVYKMSISSAVKQKRGQDQGQGRRSSEPGSSNLETINEDTALKASFKSIYIIHHQKHVATAIRRSDMQSVVLKRIRTNSSESCILRLLQSRALPGSNHIIPLLEIVERPPGISTLVMPYYTPILELSHGRAEELALQLIRGVDWLHQQLVSHSDIKETNLVFDESQNHLFIIDFGLSIKLTSREQTVRGARGTAGHVAPEVGIESSWEHDFEKVFVDEDSIYSPILADVWAVGDVINHFHQGFGTATETIGTVVVKVAKELQVDDPTKRLSLHDAERQIAAACSIVSTLERPSATFPWSHGTYPLVSTVVALQA